MEQFSNGAFWGRHHQLDDSLVGQLTRMEQTYTHAFQCVFELSKYPFDTQVVGFSFVLISI